MLLFYQRCEASTKYYEGIGTTQFKNNNTEMRYH